MTKKNTFGMAIALMSIFFITTGAGIVAPALQSIMVAFPGVPITTVLLILTLPTLIIIPSAIISGMLAGSKLKYKTLAVIGILLFVIGGIAPVFTHSDIMVIIIERAVFGVGMGILFPLGNALVLGLYGGQKRAKMLGLGTMMLNIGGIVLQFLGGLFAGIKWYYCFYPHLFGILSLIMVIFFLPEPAKAPETEGESKAKVKVPGKIWLIVLIFGIISTLFFPLQSNISIYLSITGLGDATMSGIVLSFLTIGGALGGAIFSSLFKLTKRFIVAIDILCMAAGIAIVLYGGNIILVIIGTLLAGAGLFGLFTAILMIIGMIVRAPAIAISASLLMAGMNFFIFLSTPWVGIIGSITGDAIVSPMNIGMIALAVIGALFLFINPIPKTKTEISQE